MAKRTHLLPLKHIYSDWKKGGLRKFGYKLFNLIVPFLSQKIKGGAKKCFNRLTTSSGGSFVLASNLIIVLPPLFIEWSV
jgi:hypothetical protein